VRTFAANAALSPRSSYKHCAQAFPKMGEALAPFFRCVGARRVEAALALTHIRGSSIGSKAAALGEESG
jgi:hypothetical protein